MKHRIIVEVIIDVEDHELDYAMSDLSDGIENHVAVCGCPDVRVLGVKESPTAVAPGE
jgi:hypothetical protein